LSSKIPSIIGASETRFATAFFLSCENKEKLTNSKRINLYE